MADDDEPKILGFTKKEAEILIMSLQVIRPHQCATNGCTARASDLVRIGAYADAETARAQYAALRARAMALPNLPNPTSQTQSAIAATDDSEKNDNKDNKDQPSPFLTISKGMNPAATPNDTGSEPNKDQANPFLLTEEEQKEPLVWAHTQQKAEKLVAKNKRGEGIVDNDMPTEKEWEEMGDSKAW